MRIYNCKTNHLKSPVGYAMDSAVVSWIADSERSIKQERAQIVAATDPEMKNVIFSSDPSESPDSCGFKLPVALKPRTAYYWTVQVWGNSGDTAVSDVNYFETGKREEALLGEWVTTPWEDKNVSPYVRKTFHVEGKVESARLYIAGLGLYLPEINGQKVSQEYFAPGCTASDEWVQIYTYDVTGLINEGDNALGVLLGNGWAKGRFGSSPKMHGVKYTDEYMLKAELRILLSDGSEQVIITDDTWKCTPSPVLADNIYDGEVFDETKVIRDWSCSSCEDRSWNLMKITCQGKIGDLEDRLSPPVVIKEKIVPMALIHTPAGETVLDMGQNMTGWVSVHVKEPAGTKIRLSYGEILQEGCFYRDNLRTAKAEYVYISDGTEKDVEPHFSFYGFRYVKVEGISSLQLSDFTGCVVYSDLEETGHFETSDGRINRLFTNAKWSQKDNFLDVPTDCPQRDERMGWTGDAQVFCKTASYNMDTYAFYTKYLHDFWKEQEKNHGMAPHVVPTFDLRIYDKSAFWVGGSCAWGDAAVIMPWTLYQHYGDVAILERQYPSMKAWIDWIERTYMSESGLWDGGFHFGDWLSLDGNQQDDRLGGTDLTYIASAYLKYSSGMVAKAAKVLGHKEEEAHYARISQRAKTAICERYFTKEGTCTIPTQTAHILALAMDLVDDKDRKTVAAGLVELLHQKDMHLQTGFVGTPFLCKVLSAEGYSKEAYEVLFKEDFPSWLYEVDMGATTIWERWNSVLPDGRISGTGMNSLNHYAYGSIAQWMYENIAGLTLGEKGFQRFYVKPEYTERFSFVDMKYASPKGEIAVKWNAKEDGSYDLCVKIPFDTVAVVSLPDGSGEVELNAGEYQL